jgi:hypothetical protein
MPPLNAYEAERAARIEENRRRMAEIGVLSAATGLQRALSQDVCARTPVKRFTSPSQPTIRYVERRSLRVAHIPLPNYKDAYVPIVDQAPRKRAIR